MPSSRVYDIKVLSVRKLAAVDIALHGLRFILIEFGGGVFLLALFALSGLVRSHAHSLWAWYFAGLAVNYIPLLLHAIAILRKDSAKDEIGSELHDRVTLMRYTRQQFWLLIPFVVGIASIWQIAHVKPNG